MCPCQSCSETSWSRNRKEEDKNHTLWKTPQNPFFKNPIWRYFVQKKSHTLFFTTHLESWAWLGVRIWTAPVRISTMTSWLFVPYHTYYTLPYHTYYIPYIPWNMGMAGSKNLNSASEDFDQGKLAFCVWTFRAWVVFAWPGGMSISIFACCLVGTISIVVLLELYWK